MPHRYIDRTQFTQLSRSDQLRCYLLLRSGPVATKTLERVCHVYKATAHLYRDIQRHEVARVGDSRYKVTQQGRKRWERRYAHVVREVPAP
jgi:hypothetical protein